MVGGGGLDVDVSRLFAHGLRGMVNFALGARMVMRMRCDSTVVSLAMGCSVKNACEDLGFGGRQRVRT